MGGRGKAASSGARAASARVAAPWPCVVTAKPAAAMRVRSSGSSSSRMTVAASADSPGIWIAPPAAVSAAATSRKFSMCGPNTVATSSRAGSIGFWPPMEAIDLPMKATMARRYSIPSSPIVSAM